MREPQYLYRCEIVRVVDADTLDVMVDLGFQIHVQQRIRLFGVDAPERNTPKGKQAIERVKAIVEKVGSKGWTLQSVKDKREKYGRYLGHLALPDGSDTLNGLLVAEGLAEVNWI